MLEPALHSPLGLPAWTRLQPHRPPQGSQLMGATTTHFFVSVSWAGDTFSLLKEDILSLAQRPEAFQASVCTMAR